jgi:hypothetical protein
MLRRLALFSCLLFGVSAFAQQASVTGTLSPYANGFVQEQSTGSSASINGQGFFRIPITSTPQHTFTVTPVSGGYFIPFTLTVTVATNGNTDISQQLLASLPIPNPFLIPALLVQTTSVNIAGLQYVWPVVHAAGCLLNDGSGNLSWGTSGCGGGSSGISTIGVTTANGVSGTSSGGLNPRLTVTLGNITPSSITINNSGQPTQWSFVPSGTATTVVAGAVTIGAPDSVSTAFLSKLPSAPPTGTSTGVLTGTNDGNAKVTHAYVIGATADCAASTTLHFTNGVFTGCS